MRFLLLFLWLGSFGPFFFFFLSFKETSDSSLEFSKLYKTKLNKRKATKTTAKRKTKKKKKERENLKIINSLLITTNDILCKLILKLLFLTN